MLAGRTLLSGVLELENWLLRVGCCMLDLCQHTSAAAFVQYLVLAIYGLSESNLPSSSQFAMAVAAQKRYEVSWALTKRKWLIPPGFVHEDGKWVQLRATTHGLCKLLGCDPNVTNPSLKNCKGLTWLQNQRNKQLQLTPCEDSSPKKKRKASAVDDLEQVDIELPAGQGLVTVRACKKVNEDLQVLLEGDSLQRALNYMHEDDMDFAGPSRVYQKTGKFKKPARAAADDEESESD